VTEERNGADFFQRASLGYRVVEVTNERSQSLGITSLATEPATATQRLDQLSLSVSKFIPRFRVPCAFAID
jgi:Holliday junction resolvasome RuvABC endonuclease subunit